MNNNPAIIIIRWYLGNICHYQLVLQHKSGNMDNTYPQLHKVWNRHALRIPQPRVWDATWYIVDLGPASIVDPCKCSLIRIAKNIRKCYIYIYKPIIFLDGKKYIYIYQMIAWLLNPSRTPIAWFYSVSVWILHVRSMPSYKKSLTISDPTFHRCGWGMMMSCQGSWFCWHSSKYTGDRAGAAKFQETSQN